MIIQYAITGVALFIRNFWLGLVFIVLVQLFGEWHPLTHFPMYGSFPNLSDYYYLADENGQYLATMDHFGIVNSDIKDMMENRFEETGLSSDSLAVLDSLAEQVLDEIIRKKNPNIKADSVGLYVVRTHISNGEIVYEPYELAIRKY